MGYCYSVATIGTDFSVGAMVYQIKDWMLCYKEVASITDLPKKCYNNFRVKVAGDADIDQDTTTMLNSLLKIS